MTDPFVSVIIPTYNRAKFIGKAIDSVLSQTYSDWELIVWIDGSTDETEQIVQSCQDERIKCYYEENHGKCYALNRSIELSKGTWVAILDDDDQWRQSKLQTQIEVLNKHPQIDVLFTNFTNLNEVSGEEGIGFTQHKVAIDKLTLTELEQGVSLITSNLPEALGTANFILPSSTIISKLVFQEVGLFNENLRNSEDAEFWWRSYLHGFSFAICKEILVDRIKPIGSLSSASIITYQNVIKCIDSIRDEVVNFDRQDLNYLINDSYKKTWLGLAREYFRSGDKKRASAALKQTFRYGIKFRDIFSLIGALLSPKIFLRK